MEQNTSKTWIWVLVIVAVVVLVWWWWSRQAAVAPVADSTVVIEQGLNAVNVDGSLEQEIQATNVDVNGL